MLKKKLVLGSVASVALAVAASTAFAQSPPQYPDHSLPWEYAQTAQLNSQQASEPGIIASTVTPDTTAIVASTDNTAAVEAYNQALADQQSQAAQIASDNQKKWDEYQEQLNDYNTKMQAYRSSMVVAAAPVASETVIASSGPVVASDEFIGQPTVRERIIHRPVLAQETVTRPVVHEETVTRPVVRQETFMRPVTRWETVTRDVVRNETVTRPVVTQETFTRPVMRDQIVREQVIDRPIVREQVIGERETVIAENTPADAWLIYPHHERLVVFETVTTPDTSLRGAPVMDSYGHIVGNFRHMTGTSDAVITLNDMKTVVVSDQHLRYDPMANVVVADLTYNQMESMPAA